MVAEFTMLEDFFDLMRTSPGPKEILAFTASPEDEELISGLIYKSKNDLLTPEDRGMIEYYVRVSDSISLEKTKAYVALKAQDC